MTTPIRSNLYSEATVADDLFNMNDVVGWEGTSYYLADELCLVGLCFQM